MNRKYNGYRKAAREIEPSVVVIGNFDGVHRGHQALLDCASELARPTNSPVTVYTFRPHPTHVLAPHKASPLIMSYAQREQLLDKLGVTILVEEPFDIDFSNLSPHDFIERVLVQALKPKAVIVGENFLFGHRAAGDVRLLKSQLAGHGIEVHVVSPVFVDGEVCSSTQIRQDIMQGDLKKAARLLRRPYCVEGVVIKGLGRGRSIGIPTINLDIKEPLLIGRGVYVTQVQIADGPDLFKGATNVGVRPTFGDLTQPIVETHILDFSQDVYGQRVKLNFVEKIRDEKKFESVEALVKQIKADIKICETLLLQRNS